MQHIYDNVLQYCIYVSYTSHHMQPTYQMASISAGISTAVRYKATVTARPAFCCKRLGQYWVLNGRHGGF